VSQPSMEPLSWLTLERYALDELPPGERARVERRLVESSADRACLDAILGDRSELPPLPLPATAIVLPIEPKGARRRRWSIAGGMLAVAAALTLVVLRPAELPAARRRVHDGVKGGEVALVVVSEQRGELPAHFVDGERFKLLLTCPTWLRTRLHVSVFQAGQRYEPLPEVADFVCGNRVPWPGAFALDGDAPADVCVSWDEPEEGRERRTEPGQLAPSVVCERLHPGK
jgi:hypothetical protein